MTNLLLRISVLSVVKSLRCPIRTLTSSATSLLVTRYRRPLSSTASHTFNLLDARQAISVSERQRFILRVRKMARCIAEAYYGSREALGFPMLAESATKAAR